jgi:hypothetical protein
MSWYRRRAEVGVGQGGVEGSEEGRGVGGRRPVAGRRVVESWEAEGGGTRSEVGSGTGFIVGVGHVA